ncbi:MAG: serine/threonine-protein kinase [Acidobacteriota bacterium]
MSTFTVAGPRDGSEGRGSEDPGDVYRGAILGRYTVLEAIGTGGMGTVYAAWDPELRRRVAIKVLHGALMLSETAARRRAHERLRLEAQAAARLTHPNVVTVYDVGSVGDRLFIAMELVEGQTLTQFSSEPRPWRQTLEVYRQAGQGLAAAHRAGLVHRDFKPGNVMMAEDGQVKILDFGLAKAIGTGLAEEFASGIGASEDGGETPPLRMTSTGKHLGTPRYMSPEQVLGQPVDSRSDQFSFCVSLYESLYGRLPFARDHHGPAVLAGPAGPVREPPQDAEVPRRIYLALERGLRVDPGERHPSMDDLLAELRLESGVRRRWTVAAAALAALALAVLAVAYEGLRAPSMDCQASGRQLETTWSETRQGSLRRIFERANVAGWDPVSSAIDAKVQRLSAMYVEACEATHLRGEQSSELLDRRIACLDDRGRAVEAQLRLFERGRPEILATAVSSVAGLPGVVACADREALLDLQPPPPEDDLRATVTAIREHLADALVLELAGRYDEALPLVSSAVERAEATGYRPLVGEAALQKARVVGRLGDSTAMKSLLVDAVSEALATSHRELLAHAYLQLIVVGFLRGEVGDALEFSRMAQGTISSLSDRQDLEGRRLFYLGMISIREGRHGDAVDQYRRYLDLDLELSALERVTALNNLAESLRELGRLPEALEALAQAEPLVDLLAPQHELHFTLQCSEAEVHLAMGAFELAEQRMRVCLAGLQRKFGEEHPHFANLLTVQGQIYLETDRIEPAVAALERATAIHAATPGYEARPLRRQLLLGRALWRQGRDREAALAMIRQVAESGGMPGGTDPAAAASAWLLENGVG